MLNVEYVNIGKGGLCSACGFEDEEGAEIRTCLIALDSAEGDEESAKVNSNYCRTPEDCNVRIINKIPYNK